VGFGKTRLSGGMYLRARNGLAVRNSPADFRPRHYVLTCSHVYSITADRKRREVRVFRVRSVSSIRN